MHPALKSSLLAAALSVSLFAHAAEEDAKKNLETFIGHPAVDKIAKTPYAGLYEVVLNNGQLVYTDDKASFIIDGHIIDTASKKDVTQAKLNQLATIDFSTLPLADAIKTVRGNGKRVIATFEDPNCAYCHKLAKEMQGMTDVTIYTFLYPVLGPDSVQKAKNIWCAKDRSTTWYGWMLQAKAPAAAAADCDVSALVKNAALGEKLRVTGTPTIFLADGSRIGGFMPASELNKAIDQASARK